jgi:hypothetical protein
VIRKLLVVLIVLVALLGVVVVGLSTFAAVKDRTVSKLAGPVRSVDIDVDAGHVTVAAGQANDAIVDRTRQYIRGAPRISETLVDGVLRVKAECRRFIEVGCKVDYRVEVPGAVALQVRTKRGSVTVERMTGTIDVATSAGGVRLTSTRGPVKATTSAGNVDGTDLVAGFLDATTDAGRIRLSFAEPSGRIGLQTDAGNIDVGLPNAPGGYRVMTDTRAGKVAVSVPDDPSAARAVTAKTAAGNIRIHLR